MQQIDQAKKAFSFHASPTHRSLNTTPTPGKPTNKENKQKESVISGESKAPVPKHITPITSKKEKEEYYSNLDMKQTKYHQDAQVFGKPNILLNK